MKLFFTKLNNIILKYDIFLIIINIVFLVLISNISKLETILNLGISHELFTVSFILSGFIANISIIGLKLYNFNSYKEEKDIFVKTLLDSNNIKTDNNLENIIPIAVEKLNNKVIKQKEIINHNNIIIKELNELKTKIENSKENLNINIKNLNSFIVELNNFEYSKSKKIKNIENYINNIIEQTNKIITNINKIDLTSNLDLILKEISIKPKLAKNLYNIEQKLNEIEIYLIPFVNMDKILPEDLIIKIQKVKNIISNELHLINSLVEVQEQQKSLIIEDNILKEKDFNNKIEEINKQLQEIKTIIEENIKNISNELKDLNNLKIDINKLQNIIYDFGNNNLSIYNFNEEIKKIIEKNNKIKIEE